ncbi:MAG: signal peptidase I [Lachnospiraceae bacterium]|nr:signal peptidase I [Lachnospiraceae bacterium]
MNIDDILNENIEEVVRTSVVERVHLPASETETVSEGDRKEAAAKAAKTADDAAKNAAKKAEAAAVKAVDDTAKKADSAAKNVAKKAEAGVSETAETTAAAVNKTANKATAAVSEAAKNAERETETVAKTAKSEAEDVTKSVERAAEHAAATASEYDDDDDDDDDEYVVHNAFSEDGTMVASIAAGKAGTKKAAPKAEAYEDDAEAYDGDDEEYYADGDDEELSEDGEEDEDGEEKAAPSFLRMVAGDAIFLVAVFAFFLVLLYIFPPYIVDGPSMQKTLVDKAFGFGYRYATPERGDIVIVNTGDRAKGTNGESFIKRVIAVPGDTIQCIYEQYDHDVTLSDGTVVKAGGNVYRVYLNGEMLYEPYAWFGDINTAREIKEPLTLGEDEYFVMGDNRFNSNDSRAFGPVSRADIKCTMMVFLIGKHDPE